MTIGGASSNNQVSADLPFSSGSVTLSVSYSAATAVGWENIAVEMVAGIHTFPNSGGSQPGGPGSLPPATVTDPLGFGVPLAYAPGIPVTASQLAPSVNLPPTPLGSFGSLPLIYIFGFLFAFTMGPYLLFAKRVRRPEYDIRIG